MLKRFLILSLSIASLLLLPGAEARAQDLGTIVKTGDWEPGLEDPILVSLSGFTGEVDRVIRFDLYVQGFKFVGPDEAQFLIQGSNNGGVKGRLTDRILKEDLLVKGYTGASLRDQAHAFTDDIVTAIRPGSVRIGHSRIACKVEKGATTEIHVADFDGFGAQSLTRADNTLAKSPAWVPGRQELFYTSYIRDHPKTVRHDISTGKRAVVTDFSGSNLTPAVSPDGSKVALVLSKDGMTDLYVMNVDRTNLRRLTKTREEESSPCWSPDGRWICFATKLGAARVLARVSPDGGEVRRIQTAGVANPTEPDWSPDGKWIAFTSQHRGFDICVIPAGGGTATPLVAGEDPSWAPNSRTLVYSRRSGGQTTLSLLDVPTKQFKDVPRISGSNNSQPVWAR